MPSTSRSFHFQVLACCCIFAIALAGCSRPEAGAATPEQPAEPPSLNDPTYFANVVPDRCCTIIAHAGGAIDGNSYTNSIEAINRNYKLGTRLIEIDFDKTSDGHWVAAHDWPHWKTRTKYEGELPPDLATFKALKRVRTRVSWSIESEYTSMDMPYLEEFLSQRPDLSIVTDMKELDIFDEFVNAILASPNKDQFIFQAYRVHQIDSIKEISPDSRVILTLYRLGRPSGLYEDLAARKDKLFGVTVPMNWAFDPATMEGLRSTGVPIFLHGGPSNINSRALHSDYAAKGVSGFYLD